MKITETYIRRLEITGAEGLDPIRVVLEDICPGSGRINIECWGQCWANFWGSMGKDDISDFFRTCSISYLAKKLSNVSDTVFDPEGLIDSLKKSVIQERKKGLILQTEARQAYDRIDDLAPLPETIEGLWYMSETMQELIGDEWWYSLPVKANPEYLYLCKVIKAVQAALEEIKK